MKRRTAASRRAIGRLFAVAMDIERCPTCGFPGAPIGDCAPEISYQVSPAHWFYSRGAKAFMFEIERAASRHSGQVFA